MENITFFLHYDLPLNTFSTALSGFRLRLVENFSQYLLIFIKIFNFVSHENRKFRYENYCAAGL